MISRLTINNRFKYDEVYRILEKSPKVGLYLNESPSQWEPFFKFFCKFLKSEEGPRGEVIKFARVFLQKDKKKTQQLIRPLQLRKGYLIRDVYVKFKQYVPTPLLLQYQIHLERLKEIQQSSRNINDSQSQIHKSISKGLLDKHGDQYNVNSKIREIVEISSGKFYDKQNQIQKLFQELKSCQKYQQYERMKQYLDPIIQMFDKVQRHIGLCNVQRGRAFEQKCQTEGLHLLYERLGKSSFQVAINCRWEPQDLGQIDIALIQTINGKKIVTVLVECKARLFDMCAAVKQIGPERIQKGKKNLRVKRQIIPVHDNAKHFVMIGKPSNDYHLPFQSRLKVELQKATKPYSYPQLDAKTIYNQLFPKFQNEIAPLEWFKQNSQKNLIIV